MVMLKNVSEAKYCINFRHFILILDDYLSEIIRHIWTCLFSKFYRFKHILQPIADVCITSEQRGFVDFDSFFTHTICHECCHGIGPHTIKLPNGQESTVRLVSAINYMFDIFLWLFHFFFLDMDYIPLFILRQKCTVRSTIEFSIRYILFYFILLDMNVALVSLQNHCFTCCPHLLPSSTFS